MSLTVEDHSRVRTITLSRPEALNAFDEKLYDALTDALTDADADSEVAVVVITGAGRAFSAGTDLTEMQARLTDPDFVPGRHGFIGLIDALDAFSKPLIAAVNGLGIGLGATILGFADLAFMSSTARLKCPFTSLGVAPEAASSYLLPRLVGHQNAAWILMSSEWIDADEALRMGLVFKVVEPDDLLAESYRHATVLASRSIECLIAVKYAMRAPIRDAVAAARDSENGLFARLLGSQANADALAAFAGRGN